MKNYSYLLTGLCAFIIIIGVYFFLSSHQAGETRQDQRELLAGSYVYSMPVPDYVEFCGKKISLDRYDMHERYDRELNALTYLHSTTILLMKRANRYFPIIEPILKKNNIPDDFKYLAIVESSLNTRAVSPAKAAGLWQFMPETAKRYGLEVNDQVDERYHIEKATEAACKYLSEAYYRYGDWASVAASYNGGMGRISSELNNQMANNSFDLLLVEETSRYVFRIMATKEIFKNPVKYGFVVKKEDLYPAIRTKKVQVYDNIPDLTEFARGNNISYYQLKEFNVWLRDRSLTISPKNPKTYTIDIPVVDDLYYSRNKNWNKEFFVH